MKRLPSVIFASMLLWGALSCSGPASSRDTDPLAPAVSSGIPQFDSLESRYLHACFSAIPGTESPEADSLLKRMENLACSHPRDTSLKIRVAIHRISRLRKSDPDSSSRILARTLAVTDSARHPWEYHQLMLLLGSTCTDFPKAYGIAIDNIAYSRQIGDSMAVAENHALLFHLFWLAGSHSIAREAIGNTIRIFRSMGLQREADRHEVNLAWVAPDPQRRQILRRLRHTPWILESPALANAVFVSSYELTDSIEYIHHLINILSHIEHPSLSVRQNLAIARSLAGCQLLADGDPRGALRLIKPGLEMADSMSEARFSAGMYLKGAKVYEALGMTDSASHYYARFVDARDSLYDAMDAPALTWLEMAGHMARASLSHQLKAERQRRIYWNIISVILLAASMITFILYRKIEKRRHAQQLVAGNLRQARYSLTAKQLILQEKEQWISSFASLIKEMETAGEITPQQSARLLKSLKLYHNAGEARAQFDSLHEKLDPGFYKRLKTDFPSLTEPQLQFAGYLAIGITNTQIGRLLNIAPQSVKTKRWRLRQVLGLQTRQSLEDFLRGYSRQS